jgi:endogenous inhibitor of DNA gyrase (YacG/DUF329 family)
MVGKRRGGAVAVWQGLAHGPVWQLMKRCKMPCPICSGETAPAYRPFCSRRCADVDLARWLNGSYAVPSEDPEDAEAAAEAAAEARRKPH